MEIIVCTFTSVSYTHLDVYKRQLLDELEPEALEAGLTGILNITVRQCIRGVNDTETLAQAILAAIATQSALVGCEPIDPSEPTFEPNEGAMARVLHRAASADDLAEVAGRIDGIRLPAWPPDAGKQAALGLARYLLEEPATGIERCLLYTSRCV